MKPLQDQDPDRIADYRLIGRLAQGGMGVVYLARSPRGRMVAVKTIRAELVTAPGFRHRFAQESAAARRVGGTWTAAVLDADPDAELPWVATAYIAGPTLHRVVAEQHGPLPEYSLRGLASGLCQALGAIHGAGLIHRDLKPSNVMVTVDGPKVIDFGIVRALDASTASGLTTTGSVIGSPGFMSPEQIRGERLTEASDIFSLGAVLAFAAAGRLPFDTPEGQIHAVMYRVVNEPPDLTGVPEPLLGLVRDCLAKDPADRPTLAELRDREETQYRSLRSWLPQEALARLAEDAVRLLDQEDPRTRVAAPVNGEGGEDREDAEAGRVAETAETGRVAETAETAETPETAEAAQLAQAPTAPAHPATARLTVSSATTGSDGADASGCSGAGASGGSGEHTTSPSAGSGPPERSGPRLVDERRRAQGRPPGDGRRDAVYWALALFGLVAVLTVVHQFVAVSGMGDYADDPDDLTMQRESVPAYVLMGVQCASAVGLVVCWLVWFARVRAVAEEFSPGRLRYAPRMAVLGWFVPVGNLFLPKQIANDVWHASSPPGRAGGMAPAGALHAWWYAWLVTFVTWPLFWFPWVETLDFQDDSACLDWDDLNEWCEDYEYDYWYEFGPLTWINLVLQLLVVPSVVLAGRYVRRLSALQNERRAV
ncbi:protein kinase domain-containing protein [Streptomyces sp. 4N509B]|uniref:protein kinase domain-containing protein n=1 Tax=Streptomyces sp. 4N509B TaxID=3457413 RepID=UPI003FD0282E